jgi:hypothetical protein
MNCPSCQKELPYNRLATVCPRCGVTLSTPVFQSAWVDGKTILLLTFAPGVLCLILMTLNWDGLATLVGLFGSLGCGLVSTRLLMEGFNLTGIKRDGVHFALAAVVTLLNVAFCFLGCTSGANLARP